MSNEFEEYSREQLIAMLEESNDIVNALCDFMGAGAVYHVYMKHEDKGEEE
jgi:hypothetical protein